MPVKQRLWEYLRDHRDEILDEAVALQRSSSPGHSDDDLRAGIDGFYGELVEALRSGGKNETERPSSAEGPERIGRERRQRGFEIGQVEGAFGSISTALGKVGQRTDEAFPAADYGLFNECIDAAVALAIQRYDEDANAGGREHAAKRVGYLIHEIRNAAQAARMAYAVIAKGAVGLQSRTGQVLNRNLGRIENLVIQGVAIVRVESQVPAQIGSVPLAPVLDDLVASAVFERGVTVRTAIDLSLTAEADEQLLVSAVGNLLQNAIKFTRDGGQIDLRAIADDAWVRIEVEDECGGLPEGADQDIWKPFVSKAADRRGMGLGLSITRDAMLAQHGRVGVRNLPGKGCVFSIGLPRSSARPDPGSA